jgi:hypothetical protein
MKDASLCKLSIIAVMVLLAGLFPGCGRLKEDGSQKSTEEKTAGRIIVFEDIKTGFVSVSDARYKRYEVVKTQEQFDLLYAMGYLSGIPDTEETAPAVDFATRDVAALLQGAQVSTGYSIEVKEIIESNGFMTINIETKVPGQGCPAEDAQTAPFSFISYPKSGSKVLFNEVVVVTHCDGLADVPSDLEHSVLPASDAAIDLDEPKLLEVIGDTDRFAEVYGAGTLPEVDFSQNVVLGLFAGVQPSTGFRIEVPKITEYSRQIEVEVMTIAPCLAEDAHTAPRSFVVIPATSKEIVFRETGETESCNQ